MTAIRWLVEAIMTRIRLLIEDFKRPWWSIDPWQPDPHRAKRHKELLWSTLALVIGLPALMFIASGLESWVSAAIAHISPYVVWMPPSGWIIAGLTVVTLCGTLLFYGRWLNKGK